MYRTQCGAELDKLDVTQFIVESIRDLLPLYEACHQFKP
ncbi:diadenosine tetraphosphatase [Aggregatibacter actinomycetemcomitans]|uniref:Diadenosine tetraphosphatase n=1 Tax=Aggregatibacter actinomycetemcomitans TaxID=714 RepID=A0AB74N3I6_AGGAC|nr:diadenosine tetraphosphatase [Aggregatibacter actinomycetemcomitans]PHO19915.1 diadenosine tetraphosphatase [Aggregatibacter actinomycetemcomitans]PHO22119.1 diadenosine tetraphosphatase [Aggregatibacter actinomycetemcomitans]TQE40894.1 diadenosine tetraphosphatase [Aggregatibacter actinomycetemcomitans]TYA20671.1 diadenosine tetraphosphatase [Aggregatibacter actinomycetemcomitans]